MGVTFQPEGAGGGKHRGRKNTGIVLEILRSQLVWALAEGAGVGLENRGYDMKDKGDTKYVQKGLNPV